MPISNTAAVAPALPRLDHPDRIITAWAERLVRALQVELQRMAVPAGGGSYTLTNASAASRSLDPTTATPAQAAQVLATLISDLQAGQSIA